MIDPDSDAPWVRRGGRSGVVERPPRGCGGEGGTPLLPGVASVLGGCLSQSAGIKGILPFFSREFCGCPRNVRSAAVVGERSGFHVGAVAKAGRLCSQASPVFVAASESSAGIQGVLLLGAAVVRDGRI
jgi:hypothetical protein